MLLKFFFTFVLLFISVFANVNAANQSCGIGKRCADGYYCSGAIGEAASGVCVANSVNVLLCRSIDYIKSDILKYFFLFAGVFAGIALFLGKFGFLTFVQMMTGIAVLAGAQQLITTVTGSGKGLCSKNDAIQCLQTVTGNKLSSGETLIRNLKEDVQSKNYVKKGDSLKCGLLECAQYNCQKYEAKTIGSGVNQTTECKLSSGTEEVLIKASGTTMNLTPEACKTNFTVSCTAKTGSYTRDYFKCTSCTGETFAAEAPTNWNLKTCKDLVNANISK